MIEKIKILLNMDTLIQGALFLFLFLCIYWFIPGVTLFLAPVSIISFGIKTVYDFIKNKNLEIV